MKKLLLVTFLLVLSTSQVLSSCVNHNGIVEPGEQCDDNNNVSLDGCSSDCVIEFRWNCTISNNISTCWRCGDGLVQTIEECDDSNNKSNDGCSSTCKLEVGYVCHFMGSPCTPKCGDGLIISNEQCDDSNIVNGDGCSSNCQIESGWSCTSSGCAPICGDGVLLGNEECDFISTNNYCVDCKIEIGYSCDSLSCYSGCGNAVFDSSSEECDDNNNDNGDGCNQFCKIENGWICPTIGYPCSEDCGNGIKTQNEECDDGNLVQGEGCFNCMIESSYSCKENFDGLSFCGICGNNIVEPNEECDPGNATETGCTSQCTVLPGYNCYIVSATNGSECSICGNGIKETQEECDQNSEGCVNCVVQTGWECDPLCQPICGDKIVVGNEQCDPITNNDNFCGGDTCKYTPGYYCVNDISTTTCLPVCGNYFRTLEEQCDDGNVIDNDGCSSNCTLETGFFCVTINSVTSCSTVCNDGRLRGEEQCDDKTATGGDGCQNCMIETGWNCTTPNIDEPSNCFSICGDGILITKFDQEKCDDGNTLDGDGCDSNCNIEFGYVCATTINPSVCSSNCGDGNIIANEECDDGNSRRNDGCFDCVVEIGWNCTNNNCSSICGDGIIVVTENCDDGNTIEGDGCSNCEVDSGFVCGQTAPSECIEESIENPTQSSSGSPILLIAIIVPVGAVVLIAIAILLFFILRKRNKKDDDAQDVPLQSNVQLKVNQIGAKEIVISQLIGKGQFGQVYLGSWNGTPVAMKMLKDSRIKDLPEELLDELEILKSLNHPNIIRLLGIYRDESDNEYIVMEYASKGSLLDLLRTEKSNLEFKDLLKLMIDIVNGMKNLEQNGILHRDLACRNVLVTEDQTSMSNTTKYQAKLSDFGLSRQTDEGYYKSQRKELPVKWCSPEVLDFGRHSIKSDVWAFAIVMWEILEYGKTPYPDMNNIQTMEYVKSGQRLPSPNICTPELYKLMLLCWSEKTSDRPDWSEIGDTIKNVQSSL